MTSADPIPHGRPQAPGPAPAGGYAPIAVFAYRRTEMLGRVLDSLEACPEFALSPVYVFSDGPKSDAQAAEVAAVRDMVRARLRANMQMVEAPSNQGLARSIISGVTRLCETYGRVIVIEDDLIVSPSILTWFNAALERYADEPKVMQVSGHVFSLPFLKRRSSFFLPMTTSWGWATWKRAWDNFDANAVGWEKLKSDRKLRQRFDLGGVGAYSKMLFRQMNGEIDSWAIRWYWTVFSRDGASLFPSSSLVKNIGFDSGATHGSKRKIRLFRGLQLSSVRNIVFPSSQKTSNYGKIIFYIGMCFSRAFQ